MSEREEVLNLRTGVGSLRSARPRNRDWVLLRILVYLLGDVLAVVLAHTIAFRAVLMFLKVPADALNPTQYHRYYIPFFAAIMYLLEGYKSPELRRPERELELGCKAVFVAFVGLVLFNFLVFHTALFSRYLLVTWFTLSSVLVVAARFTIRAVSDQLRKFGIGRCKVLFIGSAEAFAAYRQLLSIQHHRGYEFLGLVTESSREHLSPNTGPPVLGTIQHWEEIVASSEPDLVVMSLPVAEESEIALLRVLAGCRERDIDLAVYSKALATSNLNLARDEFSGCLRFGGRPRWPQAVQRFAKRMLNYGVGLIGSAVTAVLIPFIGLAIKFQDGGPVFYRSAFLGADGRDHYYLKFRTMRVDADQMLQTDQGLRSQFQVKQKLVDDPRVTRLGRFLRKYSLDEFPQFFSILRGELSFVGPRTIRREEGMRYGTLLPKLLSVNPGVTGYWQVMGRQNTTYEERIQMDMFYVDHWSIWLDLVIIAKTFWKVLKTEGAY